MSAIAAFCCSVLAFLAAQPVSGQGGEPVTLKSDQGRPEPVLFLELASDAMEEYHKAHGEYARKWFDLGLSFANRPFRTGETGVRPRREDGGRWRPPDCRYTYRIQQADKSTYLIEALNDDGAVVYEMRPGMEAPRKVLAEPGDDLCTAEQPLGKILPEPVMFLNAAAAAFAKYRELHRSYPAAWQDLPFHWALKPHRAADLWARPPANAGLVWTPLGGAYSYEIVRSEWDAYEIRSRNGKGLPDFRISSRDQSPSGVEP
jgi:hypothetical protein